MEMSSQPDPVLDRVRSLIGTIATTLEGRLPSERVLCEAFQVGRGELRKAMAVLEAEGKIHRYVGRGTFLTNHKQGALISDAPNNLMGLAERTSPREAMESRLALEPELASLAAIHATPRQLKQARNLAEEMRVVDNWTTYERLDSDFHSLIAHAAANGLLLELHRIVNAVRLSVVWSRLNVADTGPPKDYHSFDEHDQIVAALERHDRPGAHAAMRRHLMSILGAMLNSD
jgi:DNA-binding FadR family transcriptional regulator